MSLVTYIKESFTELKDEMTWISWIEAQKSTIVVAIFTIIFALAVFLVDQGFQNVLEQFYKLFN